MEVALKHDTITNDDEGNFISEVYTDLEDPVEAGLKARKRHQFSFSDNGDEEPSENSTYLDKYGGAIEDLNIRKALNKPNNKGKAETETRAKREEIEDEIVVELEFEKLAIPKLNTHTMHCPNCDHQITKVVLRQIIRKQPLLTQQLHEPLDLLGCFSCFSFFTSDNGGFNPFHIFGKPTQGAVPLRADGNGVVSTEDDCLQWWWSEVFIPSDVYSGKSCDGNCFSIFRVFRKEKDSKHPKPENVHSPSLPITEVINKFPIRQGQDGQPDLGGGPFKPKYQPKLPVKDDTSIDITSPETQVPAQGPAGQDSTSFEILKSIVYGGLMEVIASLSIVASAAAGDAATLNIVALALANIIGGVFIIGHNIWDLRDDCYKSSTEQTNNNEVARNKYKELLGSVEHFPLHVFFTILSFLVFGVIPPMVYGYSFHETNDTDFTMLIVAGASFVCVGLLAIFKARIECCTTFSGYVKTIMYYLTTAVATSGVSYVVGNLAKRLIEELGLFETSSNVAMGVLPEVVSMNPALTYY